MSYTCAATEDAWVIVNPDGTVRPLPAPHPTGPQVPRVSLP